MTFRTTTITIMSFCITVTKTWQSA